MSSPKISEHPLIGKFVRFDVYDGEAYSVSRIIADLGDGFLLAKRISLRTGRDLEISHILILAHLAHDEATEIYDSWEAFQREREKYENDEEPIIKLVPKGKLHDE